MLGTPFDGYLIRHVLTQNDVFYVVCRQHSTNVRLKWCALAAGLNASDMIDVSDRMISEEKLNCFVISRKNDKFYRLGKELDIHEYFR